MDMYDIALEDKELKEVGLELMFLTPEKCGHEDGITAVELSRQLNMPLDTVKKKLKILFDKGIVQVKGINPKIWKLIREISNTFTVIRSLKFCWSN